MALFCEYAQSRLKVKPGDRSLMVLPVHHIFGICAAYFMLAQGVALGVCPDFRRLYDTVGRFRVNCICLVPALAELLAEKIAQRASSVEEAFGSSIDWILIGGAPLSRRVYEKLLALGIQPLTAYGLTETTALFSIATVGEDPHIGSAGRACDLPGVEIKVTEDGILSVRGPNVMKGYYRDPEGTAKVLSSDGWFRTGDYGHIDDDGYVWITGRASRTIVFSSGKKVAPEELEERILSLPGIREVIVTGDSNTREIKAEIYAAVPESSVKRAVSALNGSLPVYKRIRTVVVRKEPFPRTDSGKIRLPGNKPLNNENNSTSFESSNAISSTRTEMRIKKAICMPFVVIFLLTSAAMAMSILGLVPDMLELKGIMLPAPVRKMFVSVDIIGELLIGFFAVLVVFKMWERRK
jgi:long-subunit acyl-CoA synthetase (AMP-forming)